MWTCWRHREFHQLPVLEKEYQKSLTSELIIWVERLTSPWVYHILLVISKWIFFPRYTFSQMQLFDRPSKEKMKKNKDSRFLRKMCPIVFLLIGDNARCGNNTIKPIYHKYNTIKLFYRYIFSGWSSLDLVLKTCDLWWLWLYNQ